MRKNLLEYKTLKHLFSILERGQGAGVRGIEKLPSIQLRKSKRSRSNSYGFSLVEMMVALGVLGIMTLAITSLMTMLFRTNQISDLKSNLAIMRGRIVSAIQVQPVWMNSIGVMESAAPAPNLPLTVTGIRNGNVSPADGWYPITVLMQTTGAYTTDYLNNPDVLLDTNVNNVATPFNQRGYNVLGRKCVGFGVDTDGTGPALGNDSCPFQWTVEWRPTCPSSVYPCIAPGVLYRVNLAYLPGPSLMRQSINTTTWSVAETSRNDPNYLASFCVAHLGTFDYVTSSCSFQQPMCTNPNERLMGIANIGTPPVPTAVCVPVLSGADNAECPAGEKLVQLNADGTKVCKSNLYGADLTVCPSGQRMVQLNATGSRTCIPILQGLDMAAAGCGPGKKLEGVDATGNPICTANLSGAADLADCPAGEKVVGINSDGTRRCVASVVDTGDCAVGEKVIGVNSDGSKRCGPIFPAPVQCTGGRVLNAVWSTGTSSCVFPACPNGWTRIGSDVNGAPLCELETVQNWSVVGVPCGSVAGCNQYFTAASCPNYGYALETDEAMGMWYSGAFGCSSTPNTSFGLGCGPPFQFCTTEHTALSTVSLHCAYAGGTTIGLSGEFACRHRMTYL